MKVCPRCDRHFDNDVGECPDDGARLLIIHDPGAEQDARLIGRTIAGRYKITRRLGAGGMGAVFLAEQTAVGRQVAIKVLSQEVASNIHLVKRFFQEAKTASAMSHPNTITIHDFGQEEDGLLYLVMEFVAGETLASIIARDAPLPLDRAVNITVQVLNALDEAYGLKIIHRDLKPENVLVTSRSGASDFVTVLDFGLAKATGDGDGGASGLTKTGQVFGTPGYMSPEQAKGQSCDHRADLYAVGVIFYELLSGQRPFTGDGPLSVLVKHINSPPPAFTELPRPVSVAPEIAAVVFRSIAKEREDRYATPAEMSAALISAYDVVQRNGGAFGGGNSLSGGTGLPLRSPSQHPSLRPQASANPVSYEGTLAPAEPGVAASPALNQPAAPPSMTFGSGIMGQVSRPNLSAPDLSAPGGAGASRARIWLALGAAVLLLGGGIASWQGGFFGGGDSAAATNGSSAAAGTGPGARPTAPPPYAPSTSPDAGGIAQATPEDAGAALQMVKVQVTSDPTGASARVALFRTAPEAELPAEDTPIGDPATHTTPVEIEAPLDARISVTFELDGHEPLTLDSVARASAVINAKLVAAVEPPKPGKGKPAASRWRPRPPSKAAAGEDAPSGAIAKPAATPEVAGDKSDAATNKPKKPSKDPGVLNDLK